MRNFAFVCAALILSVACSEKPKAVYQDPRASVDRRAADLLRRMTEAEKQALRNGSGNPAPGLRLTPPASGLALAATWNPTLVGKLGIQSDTAFGAYGEDPWLASRMTVAWTSAVQSDGRIATLLRFPCASGDERTENEILYPPFRAAIEEAGLWSVTGSCADYQPLADWGFRGFVVGAPPAKDDDDVRRILLAMFAAGLFDGPPEKKDPAESKRVARLAGEQSVVLLKNEGDLLPLYATRLKSIAVIGSGPLAAAIRQRAGATPVVENGPADVTINAGETIAIHDATRHAELQAWGDAVAATDVIFGDANPSGRLPVTIPKKAVDSNDGIYTGYRWFDAHNVEPLYPFGFGLSYTTFDWSDLRIFPATPRYGQTVQVVVKVRNTGSRSGTETVEVYIHQMKSSADRPPRELKAFAQVDLKPGEERDVALRLDRHSMSFYDPAVHAWATEPGIFEVLAGASSRDIRLKGSFELFR